MMIKMTMMTISKNDDHVFDDDGDDDDDDDDDHQFNHVDGGQDNPVAQPGEVILLVDVDDGGGDDDDAVAIADDEDDNDNDSDVKDDVYAINFMTQIMVVMMMMIT